MKGHGRSLRSPQAKAGGTVPAVIRAKGHPMLTFHSAEYGDDRIHVRGCEPVLPAGPRIVPATDKWRRLNRTGSPVEIFGRKYRSGLSNRRWRAVPAGGTESPRSVHS